MTSPYMHRNGFLNKTLDHFLFILCLNAQRHSSIKVLNFKQKLLLSCRKTKHCETIVYIIYHDVYLAREADELILSGSAELL